jgi:Domain of unknown function (DUF1949)
MMRLFGQVGFDSIGVVYQQLDKHSAERRSEDFPEDSGRVRLRVVIEEDAKAALCSALMDATQGQVILKDG